MITAPCSPSARRFLARSGCGRGGVAFGGAVGCKVGYAGLTPAGEATEGETVWTAATSGLGSAGVPGTPDGAAGRGNSTAAARPGGERLLAGETRAAAGALASAGCAFGWGAKNRFFTLTASTPFATPSLQMV